VFHWKSDSYLLKQQGALVLLFLC